MTIFKAMGTMDTVLTLSGPSTFSPIGGLIQIDSEQMTYVMSTDDQLYGLVRGVNGTSAATHAKGATVTSLESVPTSLGVNPRPLSEIPYEIGNTLLEADGSGTLTDPTSISQNVVDQNTVIYIFGHASNFTGSLPTPTVPGLTRKLLVLFATDAAKTATVNSVSIAAGSGQLFVWSATAQAWFAC